MSTQIDAALVRAYRSNILLTAAQDDTRLRSTVDVDLGVTGESAYYDRIGTASFQISTSRHGDSPQIDIPHSRRRADFSIYETGDQIDKADAVRIMQDPVSSYVRRQAGALNRAIDDEIIDAFERVAVTGKTGSGTASFDTTNQVVDDDYVIASSGLTLEKVIRAKEILDGNEVPSSDRFFVASSQAFGHLLRQTEATSSDYVTIKALVQGQIDTWLGFKWIRSERLPFTSPDRSCYAYHRDAIKLGMPMDLSLDIDPARSDKKFNTYIMYQAVFGAVRMEEERIVRIEVDEVTAALS